MKTLIPITIALALATAAAAQIPDDPDFRYDTANRVLPATRLGTPNARDACLIGEGGGWMTWLEYTPAGDLAGATPLQIDRIMLQRNLMTKPEVFASQAGRMARPSLAWDSTDQLLYISRESETGPQRRWVVVLGWRDKDGHMQRNLIVARGNGSCINHAIAADPAGGVWVVWQEGRDGQYDIALRHARVKDSRPKLGPVQWVGESPRGDWAPDLAVAPDGSVYVVWDAYDGESQNVYLRRLRDGQWSDVVTVAGSPAFEGRAQVAAGPDGRVWLAWEEGSRNWGRLYRGKLDPKGPVVEEMNDLSGPLHRFRRIRMARVDDSLTVQRLKDELPMPSVALAHEREGLPEGVRDMGAYYERAELSVDPGGRPWIAYRHYYVPWQGSRVASHVYNPWGVYLRYLSKDGWSPLFGFKEGQGDGMQRLSLATMKEGTALAWTTGRTDRKNREEARGVALSLLLSKLPDPPGDVELLPAEEQPRYTGIAPRNRPRPVAEVGDATYPLCFGDLHRHTDLSLCRYPSDGTIDDAYRYAIDVEGLDFLGITDHTRDVAKGDALSQLWWRCTSEVSRHDLSPTFIPFFSYERSHSRYADHNVISLRDDMLRPWPPPLAQILSELGSDTIMIPHQPFRGVNWKVKDDGHRTLFEIYQGCRDNSVESDAHEGLSGGHHFGLIASSDHLSTGASYAGVWAAEPTREAVFLAMQERRTFGATTRMRLLVQAQGHAMGERFGADTMPEIAIDAEGTAPFQTVDVIVDGAVEASLAVETAEIHLKYTPKSRGAGEHFIYVRAWQENGERGWSSPLWVYLPERP